eukprot:m.1816 g.1816  ORF g.1816 m.1816 type:complete len:162 (+) comp7885_c0_seq2:597-1082(+)
MEEVDAGDSNGLVNDSWVQVPGTAAGDEDVEGEAPYLQSSSGEEEEGVQEMLAEAARDANGSERPSSGSAARAKPVKDSEDGGDQAFVRSPGFSEEETVCLEDWDADKKEKKRRKAPQRRFSLRGSWLLRRLDASLPVLICSHLLSFVIGIFIGHRWTVVS